jgi:hypothetical protein
MQRMGAKTYTRIFVGLMIGVVASGAFLIAAVRFWESLIVPYPPHVTETRKLVILLVEIGIYCAAGLVFGVVNSLFVPPGGRALQVILGASLALIISLPFTFIEGSFLPSMLIIPVGIAAACAFFITVGQQIVFRFRKTVG